MPDGSEPPRIEDLDQLATLFLEDRETHLYGLADLEEPFRTHSSWFGDGDAVVGIISTGGDWQAGYAMSRVNPEGTLEVLGRLGHRMPPGTLVTGPLGLHRSLSPHREVSSMGVHWRMIFEGEASPASDAVNSLGPDDESALVDLYGSDPGAAFFLPSMLTHGHFVGIEEDGRLLAAAGTHVASRRFGVAALGAVLTRPERRGQGMGREVTIALLHSLVGEYQTIGLNVAASNTPAIGLYETVGFGRRFEYEEAELL